MRGVRVGTGSEAWERTGTGLRAEHKARWTEGSELELLLEGDVWALDGSGCYRLKPGAGWIKRIDVGSEENGLGFGHPYLL